MPETLLKIERASQAIAECKTVDEAKAIRDKAAAVAVYLRQTKASLSAQQDAVEIGLWSERRMGELLKVMPKAEGARAPGTRRGTIEEPRQPPTLMSVGVGKRESAEAQQLAEVPEPEFRAEVAKLRSAGKRPTRKAVLRKTRRKEKIAKLAIVANGNKALDGECGLAAVLYSDPAWRYDDNSTDPTRVIENQYPTLTHEQLCALGEKVQGICTPDAILYLWVPPPILEQGLAVMRAWGFEYKTGSVWDKQKIGCGYFFRQRHEHLLVGERGKMPKPEPSMLESSVYCEPRGAHSVKPTHYYEMLEHQYPSLPKRELFARGQTRPGWLPSWGNQAK